MNLLKLIQLGISFHDEQGNVPNRICCWQFNFRFSLTNDMFAQNSIDLLNRSGIQFARHESVRAPPSVWLPADLGSAAPTLLAPACSQLTTHTQCPLIRATRVFLQEGIDVQRFGELIMTSGLVLCDEVSWITFHSGCESRRHAPVPLAR